MSSALKLGRRLRKLRRSANMTQSELALFAGVHAANVSAYERGTRGLGLAVAQRLARALGVELGQIFSNDEDDVCAKGDLTW